EGDADPAGGRDEPPPRDVLSRRQRVEAHGLGRPRLAMHKQDSGASLTLAHVWRQVYIQLEVAVLDGLVRDPSANLYRIHSGDLIHHSTRHDVIHVGWLFSHLRLSRHYALADGAQYVALNCGELRLSA